MDVFEGRGLAIFILESLSSFTMTLGHFTAHFIVDRQWPYQPSTNSRNFHCVSFRDSLVKVNSANEKCGPSDQDLPPVSVA